MLNQGARRFDLYDFFSIFIPGAATLLGLLPFLPKNTSIPFSGIVGLVVIGGFVVGRSVHATALWLEEKAGATTHRDKFKQELLDPDGVSHELRTQFYNTCYATFDMEDLPESCEELDEDHRENLDDVYTLVRSYIHIDARGRARTFQAVLDFYRSIWVASFGIALTYMLYSVLAALNVLSASIVAYQSYLGNLGIHYSLIFYGAVLVIGGAYGTFERVRSDYREYFIQYLFSDFVILQSQSASANDGSDSGMVTDTLLGPSALGQPDTSRPSDGEES